MQWVNVYCGKAELAPVVIGAESKLKDGDRLVVVGG